MGYSRDAFKGISWLGGFRLVFRFLTYIKLALIARLLNPSQFGSVDIAILMLGLVEILTETGINVFLVQEKEKVDEYIDTAWVISILRGIAIAVFIFFTAGFISSFFNSSSADELLVLVSLVPLIRGFINPSVVKFLKDLDYQKQFYYRSSITFIEVITSIFIVWSTFRPEGLIWGLIIGAIWEVIVSYLAAAPKPKLSFNINKFSKVIRSGKWLTLSGIFDYLYLNLDNIVIGKLLGTGSLGLYMRSYSISLLPITEISDVFNQTTFPIYVKIAGEKTRLWSAYFRTLVFVTLLVVPVSVIFSLFPEEIIRIVLGEKWLIASAALRILALYGALRAIMRTTIGLFYSLKRQDIISKLTGINLFFLVVIIIPFVNSWGIVGAGTAAFVSSLLSIPFFVYYVNKVFS